MNGVWDDDTEENRLFASLREGGGAWAPLVHVRAHPGGFTFNVSLSHVQNKGTTFSRAATRTEAELVVYGTKEEARDAAVAEVQRLAMLGHFTEPTS